MWSWSWPAKDHFSRNDLDQRSDHFKRSLITWFRGVAGIMHGTFSRYDRNQDYVVRLIIIFPLPLQHNWPKDQRKRGSVGSELLDRWLTQWTNGTQGKGRERGKFEICVSVLERERCLQRGVNLFELGWEKVSARLQPATAGNTRLVLSEIVLFSAQACTFSARPE